MPLDAFIMQRLAFDMHVPDPLSNPKFREGVMAKLAYLSRPSSVLDDADGKIFSLETRRKAVRQLEEQRRKAASLEASQRASREACGHIDRYVRSVEDRHSVLARSGLPRAAGFVAKIGVHLSLRIVSKVASKTTFLSHWNRKANLSVFVCPFGRKMLV